MPLHESITQARKARCGPQMRLHSLSPSFSSGFLLRQLVVKDRREVLVFFLRPKQRHLIYSFKRTWSKTTSFWTFNFLFFFKKCQNNIILAPVVLKEQGRHCFGPFYFKKNRPKQRCFGAYSFKIKNRPKQCRFDPVFHSNPFLQKFSLTYVVL